jgi:hypothetical protein
MRRVHCENCSSIRRAVLEIRPIEGQKRPKTSIFDLFVADVSSEEIGKRQQIEQATLYKT